MAKARDFKFCVSVGHLKFSLVMTDCPLSVGVVRVTLVISAFLT